MDLSDRVIKVPCCGRAVLYCGMGLPRVLQKRLPNRRASHPLCNHGDHQAPQQRLPTHRSQSPMNSFRCAARSNYTLYSCRQRQHCNWTGSIFRRAQEPLLPSRTTAGALMPTRFSPMASPTQHAGPIVYPPRTTAASTWTPEPLVPPRTISPPVSPMSA
jgi:hypothetical protein